MNIEDIQKFLDKKATSEYTKISFKKRNSIHGRFILNHKDYGELKSKNFWRIVPESQFTAYKQSPNVNLAKIFHGSEFSRLSSVADQFE